MIGIFKDADIVTVPKPAVAESNIIGSNAEKESAESETSRAATAKVKHMAAPEPSAEPPVFPGMVEMIVRITATGIVSDPFAIRVHMGSVGVSVLIAES